MSKRAYILVTFRSGIDLREWIATLEGVASGMLGVDFDKTMGVETGYISGRHGLLRTKQRPRDPKAKEAKCYGQTRPMDEPDDA